MTDVQPPQPVQDKPQALSVIENPDQNEADANA